MGSERSVMDQERDLGVLVDSSKEVSTQCAAAVKKANSMDLKINLRIVFLYHVCCLSLELLATGCGDDIWPR